MYWGRRSSGVTGETCGDVPCPDGQMTIVIIMIIKKPVKESELSYVFIKRPSGYVKLLNRSTYWNIINQMLLVNKTIIASYLQRGMKTLPCDRCRAQ